MCLAAIDGQPWRRLEVDREAVLDGVAAESCAGAGREQRLVGSAGAFCEPGFEDRPDCWDQWCSPCLSSLAGGLHVRAGPERDVLAVEGDQFGDPQAGLDREREHRVVASPGPGGLVTGGKQRVDLGVGEIGQEVLSVRLAGIASTRAIVSACSG